MKLNKEKADLLDTINIDEDSFAKCINISESFKKIMFYYKFGKPIWAHKDFIVVATKKKRKNENHRQTKNS